MGPNNMWFLANIKLHVSLIIPQLGPELNYGTGRRKKQRTAVNIQRLWHYTVKIRPYGFQDVHQFFTRHYIHCPASLSVCLCPAEGTNIAQEDEKYPHLFCYSGNSIQFLILMCCTNNQMANYRYSTNKQNNNNKVKVLITTSQKTNFN
jgi:hypothetical protein